MFQSMDAFRSIDINLLTKDEEKELAGRIRQGDKDAWRSMIVNNIPLVIHRAKKYRDKGVPFEDLIQEGCNGLIVAVERYDPEKGGFANYAVPWIRQYIQRAIYGNNLVYMPEHIVRKAYAVMNKKSKMEEELCRSVSICEAADTIATYLGTYKVGEDCLYPKSLNERVVHYKQGGDAKELSELIEFVEDTHHKREERQVFIRQSREYIDDALGYLNEQERQVLTLRYGLDDGVYRTLDHVGSIMDLSRERIRQIEHKALRRLRRGPGRKILRPLWEELHIDEG